MEQNQLKATHHAVERAKERFHWNKETLFRMMYLAFDKGFKHSDTKGTLKRFMDKLWLQHHNANNVRIYGENLYFFANRTLITLYRIDTKLTKYLRNL